MLFITTKLQVFSKVNFRRLLMAWLIKKTIVFMVKIIVLDLLLNYTTDHTVFILEIG